MKCSTLYNHIHTHLHYNVIMGAMAPQITSLTIVYSTVYSGQIKENTKAPRHWPLCGEFTVDRWIPRTKGQQRRKCFHLMTSSWHTHSPALLIIQSINQSISIPMTRTRTHTLTRTERVDKLYRGRWHHVWWSLGQCFVKIIKLKWAD